VNDPLHHILYLGTASILLGLGLVVTVRHRTENRRARLYLLGYLYSFFLAAAVGYIVLTPDLIARAPHFFRTAHIFFSMVMPFSWLYVREVLVPGRSSWKDVWYFLPVILYVVDYLPVFLLSSDEKLAMIRQLNNYGMRIGYREGRIMPPGGYHVLRSAVAVLCWLLQVRLFYRNNNKTIPGSFLNEHRKWILCMIWTGMLIFLPNILTGLFDRSDLNIKWSNFAALTAAVIQGYFLLLHPELLYGRAMDLKTVSAPGIKVKPGLSSTQESETPAYFGQLDTESIQQMEKAIEELLKQRQMFLKPDLRLSDLASASGISTQKWSAYFNKFQQSGFTEYINRMRLNYCIQKLEEGEHKHKTLEALSVESGFQSRSTFIRTFKKYKGVTPSDYLESISRKS
jgi:AraC-like DNA-binding protein